MTSQSILVRIVALVAGIACGCASDGFKTMSDGSSSDKPRSTAEREAKKDTDPWDDVGREARSDRPVQKENDPLRDLFVSPKAQEIERSLGVQ